MKEKKGMLIYAVVDDSAGSYVSLWLSKTGERMLVKKDDALEGVIKGVPCSESESGTVAAPAAALDGVWASNKVELRFSFTER